MNLVIDDNLATVEAIRERLAIIRRNRDILCDTPCKNNNIAGFRRKNEKIAILTTREGKLTERLHKMLRESNTTAVKESAT